MTAEEFEKTVWLSGIEDQHWDFAEAYAEHQANELKEGSIAESQVYEHISDMLEDVDFIAVYSVKNPFVIEPINKSAQ